MHKTVICVNFVRKPHKIHPWEWPEFPWCRINFNNAGPFMSKMFLVLVDAHFKWMDVHMLPHKPLLG